MQGFLVLLAIGGALYVAATTAYVFWWLTHPPRRTYAWALARGLPGDPSELTAPRAFDDVRVKSDGLDLPAWVIPGDRPDGPCVVVSHGWSESRLHALARLAALTPWASRVIAWDQPGHGECPGWCTLGLAEPERLAAIVRELADGRPVALMGSSMGAGVSLACARTLGDRCVGVICEAPYRRAMTPAWAVLGLLRLPRAVQCPAALWLVGLVFGGWRGFDRAAIAASLECPLLVVHGTEDEVCPVQDGQAIATAGRGRFVLVPGGQHADLWTDEGHRQVITRAITEFAEGLEGSGRPR